MSQGRINMKSKNITQKFRITVLTPVHIGTGFRKMKGIDFYFDERTSQVILVDLDEIGTLLVDNSQALNELANLDEQNDIGDLTRRYHLNLKNNKNYPINSVGREFLEFVRTGLGQPLIPGSSLKGSLRTAILRNIIDQKSDVERRELFKEIPNGGNPKSASDDLLRNIFGRNPNYDLMRVLVVSDSHFSESDLMLIELRVLSQNRNGWYWKSNPKNPNQPMQVWCEALRPNSKAEISLSLDNFLLTDSRAVWELKFPNKLAADLHTLIDQINQYSAQMIDAEITYFEERDSEKPELNEIIRNLNLVKKHIPANDSAMVVRLGWGSGWKHMTGDYLGKDKDIFEQIRMNFRLGHPGRSRKIGFYNGKPAFPFGWIKLEALK